MLPSQVEEPSTIIVVNLDAEPFEWASMSARPADDPTRSMLTRNDRGLSNLVSLLDNTTLKVVYVTKRSTSEGDAIGEWLQEQGLPVTRLYMHDSFVEEVDEFYLRACEGVLESLRFDSLIYLDDGTDLDMQRCCHERGWLYLAVS